MRETCDARAERVAEIVASDPGPVLVWCHTNYEADAIKKAVPGILNIQGSDSTERKEDGLIGFSDGKYRVLLTKPSIAGFGMNWQHCSRVVFVGLSYSYESFYQAVRRCWRFGQKNQVNVHVVMSQHEEALYKSVSVKRESHEEMQDQMAKYAMFDLSRNYKLEYERETKTGRGYEARLGDSVELIKEIPDNSVGFSVFSPPFASLFTYSDSPRDLGNCSDMDEFHAHFKPIIQDLYRVMIPGRLVAVHTQTLMYYKGRDGFAGIKDFRGGIIRLFESAGFVLHSEVTIDKSPVTEMYRTKAQGLLYNQLCKDSTISRQGMCDYLEVFAKTPESDELRQPVVGKNRAVRFGYHIGTNKPNWDDYEYSLNPITGNWEKNSYEKMEYLFSLAIWQRYANGVWFDIDQTRVLNHRGIGNNNDEKHVCPLQLDVIERAINLWSNEGDLVFSPFMGIGSEGYGALKLGRRFLGIELKREYFDEAVKNLEEAAGGKQLDLFPSHSKTDQTQA